MHTEQKIVDTAAIMALQSVVLQLNQRRPGDPALAQFYGATGMGKTTAALAARVRSPLGKVVIARAQQVWATSPKNVLAGLLLALDEPVASSAPATVLQQRLVDALVARECLLVIDEADYLCSNERLVNTLRDIHDNVPGNQPMILIGEESLPKKLETIPRVHNRFLVRKPCPKISASEIRQVCAGSGVSIVGVVLDRLLQHHGWSVRSMIGAVREISEWASERGLETVADEHWHQMPKGGRIEIRAECL